MKWYQLKADGTLVTEKAYETQEILIQHVNIAQAGFAEETPESGDVPVFYEGPVSKSGVGSVLDDA